MIDGDTVILEGGDHLRLIGVDTPELGRDGEPDQPGAEPARRFLMEQLPPGTAVALSFDTERRDRHGRLLAHLFRGGSENMQAHILAGGLATPLTVPPNLGFLQCYRQAAKAAAAEGRGLWALPRYQPTRAGALEPAARGYHVVQGVVTRRGDSATSLWLDLDGTVGVRIVRDDLVYFRDFPLEALPGTWLEARGILYRQNGQLRMRIRHPADLQRLEAEPR